MTQSKSSRLHIYILLGVLVLALGLRLFRSGNPPLDDGEAAIALQALAAAENGETVFGAFPAYVGLTGLGFNFIVDSTFLARFWPALIGALLVFIPQIFRKWIGQWPATFLSLVLAISPEMVGLSRIIGSPMMAFVFLLLGIGLFLNRKPAFAGIALALALMSGSGFWMGVLILGLSVGLSEWLFQVSELLDLPEIEDKKAYWINFGVAFGTTLGLVGSGFFLAPANLSGVFAGLMSFIQGFAVSSGTPLLHYLLVLVGYTSEAFLIGIAASVRAFFTKSKLDLFLMVWWLVGLTFIILYPAGSAADMIWVTLPLWLLTIRLMFFAWRKPRDYRFITAVTAIVVVIVMAFMLLAFRGLIRMSAIQTQNWHFLVAIAGGALLLIAIVVLVWLGWSQEAALSGLLAGLAVVFVSGLFALSVHSTGLAPESSMELWYPEWGQVTDKWLRIELDRIVGWNASGSGAVEIAVSDYDLPSMRWFLRNDPAVTFVPYPPVESQPGILIARIDESPKIASSYRGQDLVWSREAVWQVMTPVQYLSWLLTRDATSVDNQIILWVRTDLMPDYQILN